MHTDYSPAPGAQPLPPAHKKFIGAVKDDWQMYSDCASDYTIGAPIGFGASSIVYTALYHPQPEHPSATPPQPIPCALKVLDLDSLPPRSLHLLQRETTLMSLSKHPNVLRVRGSWIEGHKLYIALRLMNKGSAADVIRYGWPGGMEEDVCRCILAQALKGLNYLHINGFIHRDVKAANLLIDDDGTVLLGDLGVAADLAEDPTHHLSSQSAKPSAAVAVSQVPHISSKHSPGTGKRSVAFDSSARPRMGKRKSFVGTPCWMAPEIIQGKQYDSSADIWSFGITALELTQGRPPRSRESPQNVLLRTIQEDPPSLDREGGTYKYSRAFKEIVDSCLAKDPSKRPTAEELLQTPFFKSSKKKSYLVNAILKDLPPLTQRQERRIAKSSQSLHSIDSWDFATTVHSPTSSIYRRRMYEDTYSVTEPATMDNVETVFEMEEERPRKTAEEGAVRSPPRTVSWTEIEPVYKPHKEYLEPVPSSPSDSQGSGRLSESPEEDKNFQSPPSPSTAPSSVPESPSVAVTPALPIPEKASNAKVNLGWTSGTSPTEGGPSLWSKFKSNVRRPSSRGGPVEPGAEGRVGMGSKFAEAGKNMLSRTSSRTAQAVGALIQGKSQD